MSHIRACLTAYFVSRVYPRFAVGKPNIERLFIPLHPYQMSKSDIGKANWYEQRQRDVLPQKERPEEGGKRVER